MANLLDTIIQSQGLVILDGALATELEARGANLNHSLWSAKLLVENPALIQEVHLDYLNAGANVISTASYQASFVGFEKNGYSKQEAIRLMQLSIDIAIQARDFFLKNSIKQPAVKPLIAASIGPYGAAMADGSEYTGYVDVSVNALIDFHKERLQVLMNTDADIFAFETIPSIEEAVAIIDLLKEYPTKQAWLSFSCKDGVHLSSGALFEDAVKLINESNEIIGVGVNCTAPKYISSLITIAKSLTNKIILVYPNKGEHYNPITKTWEEEGLAASGFIDNAKVWFASGSCAIGGCCRTTPSDIKQLNKLIK